MKIKGWIRVMLGGVFLLGVIFPKQPVAAQECDAQLKPVDNHAIQ